MSKKIRLVSKSMTSQPGQQTTATNILTNISRSKDNQAIELGQLIWHNMKNIFLKKNHTQNAM